MVVMSIVLFAFMAITETKKDETNKVVYGHSKLIWPRLGSSFGVDIWLVANFFLIFCYFRSDLAYDEK